VNESSLNPVFYAAVTDAKPVARRKVVDLANCNKCHDQLSAHGRGRRSPEFCVFCHNPNESDRRPASLFPPEAIDFKRHIHRIHTGKDLTQDYTVIGTSGTGTNFNDVRFPGDRRDCLTCHVPGANQVLESPPPGLLPTNTLRDWYAPQQHFAAACLGCHDSKPAAAHAYVMTAPFGESCAACHGPEDEFAVDKVHAR
jgi:OmcA/MtrC family decaheme c-type cytochrome